MSSAVADILAQDSARDGSNDVRQRPPSGGIVIRRKRPCTTNSRRFLNVTASGILRTCPEIPGANGQGRTKEEARQSLAGAITLILEDRREEGLRGVPADAERETVTVR